MRKTRLVILPTKCLHQMGFLLLFLSCPVIGDWGRIQPDNENLQKAIEIEREGVCGLQRDFPEGSLDFVDEKGFSMHRFREENDLNLNKLPRFDERRDVRRLPPSRLDKRRSERSMESRREADSQERSVRSRNVQPTRNDRNEGRARSLFLNGRKSIRRQTRGESANERRDNERRLSLARMIIERSNSRRIEQREGGRIIPILNEKIRSSQRRENERLSLERREEEMRRQNRNSRGEPGRRLSLFRREEISRNVQRSEGRGSSERANFERRESEIQRFRNDKKVAAGNPVRFERNIDSRQKVDKRSSNMDLERNVRGERRAEDMNRRVETREKTRRVSAKMNYGEAFPEDKTESFFTGIKKWLNLNNYKTPTVRDWSNNCMMGAVACYLSTRPIKTA